MKDINDSWEKFLNPNILKDNLTIISLYNMTFEILKSKIESLVDDFFEVTRINEKKICNDEYKSSVLSLVNKNEQNYYVKASIKWLIEINILEKADWKLYDDLRVYRNDLTHEFQKYLIDDNFCFDNKKLHLLVDLFIRLEKNWIKEFEVILNPAFDNKKIELEDVTSMQIIILQIIYDIALNNEPEESFYLKLYNSSKNK